MASNNVPIAIIGAGALVGLGLFFGLRQKAPDAPTSQPSIASAASENRAPQPPATVVSTAAPTGVVALDKVKADVTKALDAEKTKSFLPMCWKPLLAKTPKPDRAKYTFDMAFDAQGKEISRGISEHREAERSDVGICLRKLPIGLTIPPPGGPVSSLAVDIEFP